MSLTKDLILSVYTRQKGICLYCNEYTQTMDGYPHRVIPKAEGGTETLDNLVWCCHECKPHIRGDMRIAQGLAYLRSVA